MEEEGGQGRLGGNPTARMATFRGSLTRPTEPQPRVVLLMEATQEVAWSAWVD